MKLKWLAATILIAGMVEAQPIGISFLAASKFTPRQCHTALRAFRGVVFPAFQTLWGTFGVDTRCIKHFIRRMKDRPHLVHIHPTNQTCRRKGRTCGKVEIDPPSERRRFVKRLRRIVSFVESVRTPNTAIVISTGLEDEYTTQEFSRVVRLIKREVPYEIVRNPIRFNVPIYPLRTVELHSSKATFGNLRNACIWSNDGEDIDFGDGGRALDGAVSVPRMRDLVRGYRNRGCIVFVWWNTQGLAGGTFVPPGERSIRVDSGAVRVVNEILREVQS